jgi:multicomponent Na+:H+ antiporter subunit D
VSVWLAWAVAVPLAGACAALFLPRAAARIGMAASLATAGAAAAVAGAVWHEGALRHPLGGWSAPLGIELRADGLSALMLLMTAVTSLPVGIYATRYFEPRGAAEDGRAGGGWTAPAAYWPLALFLWAALNALFLSGDVFNLYVTLELMTLAAVALVTLGERPVSLTAGMRYLLAAFLGSLGYLLGVALLYGQAGTLDLVLLAERGSPVRRAPGRRWR